MRISLPVCRRSQRGSLTVPMSSHWRWWVQPSEMSTVSPSRSESMAAAPRTAVSSRPLLRAIRMEKEVRGISAGVSAEALANTWLSVMTMAGFVPRRFSVSFSSVSWVTTAMA